MTGPNHSKASWDGWQKWRNSDQGSACRDLISLVAAPSPTAELERRLKEAYMAGQRAGATKKEKD